MQHFYPFNQTEGVDQKVELVAQIIREGTFIDTLKALLRSRKFLIALLGIGQTLAAHYFDVPAEVWASIDGLLVVVIGAIAHEDAAEKRGAS